MASSEFGGKSRARKVQVWIYQRHREPRVLIFKTTPKRGDFWQPVTGGVEAGETYAEAALREAREESGHEFGGAPEDLEHSFEFDGQWGAAEECAFALNWMPDEGGAPPIAKVDPTEHVEYRWVSLPEAAELIRFDSNRAALHRLAARLT